MPARSLVLDANILIRAVLGQRVAASSKLMRRKSSSFIPETAFAEAEEHLAALVVKHGGDPLKALAALKSIAALGTVVGPEVLQRLRIRSAEAAWSSRP
jgi:hypothetical protein